MTRIPGLVVEKVHLGVATPTERASVLADPEARARLAALPADDAAFFAAMPVEEELRRIEGKRRIAAAAQAQAGPQRGRNRATLASIALAPALAVMLAVAWGSIPGQPDGIRIGPDPASPGPTTAKGSDVSAPRLRVYRQSAAGAERLGAGAVAREGDVLQLGVAALGEDHAVVVSVDGRGTVTLHWPPSPTQPTAIGRGENRVPQGYALDDAPEFERFFLVSTGTAEADVSTVVHAAEALAAQGEARTADLSVPRDYVQSSFLVRKEAR
ncbi:MAG: hypothetical protein ABMB14_28665 [Myxococcota bacterium]